MTVTNPTLAGNGTKTFASSTSATLTLYGVQSEVIRKSANMIDMPLPMTDSNGKLLFDLMGTSREITIEGKVTNYDVANLYNYAQDLAGLGTNSLIFGSQGTNTSTAGYVYTSYILNIGNSGATVTVQVYVNDVQITSEAGNTNSFNYTITLMECSGTGSA